MRVGSVKNSSTFSRAELSGVTHPLKLGGTPGPGSGWRTLGIWHDASNSTAPHVTARAITRAARVGYTHSFATSIPSSVRGRPTDGPNTYRQCQRIRHSR